MGAFPYRQLEGGCQESYCLASERLAITPYGKGIVLLFDWMYLLLHVCVDADAGLDPSSVAPGMSGRRSVSCRINTAPPRREDARI